MNYSMELPNTCPNCGRTTDRQAMEWFSWIKKSEPDIDSGVEDQIFQCSKCDTLFMAKWKLVSFKELKEVG